MARKNQIRVFLEVAIIQAKKDQDKLALSEKYEMAAVVKTFKDILIQALSLCGEEKPKENKIER